MSDCSTSVIIERQKSDHAFMGTTHALSAVAVFLMLTAFFPSHVYAALGSSSIWVVILAMINIVGACLSVDLDNTASTSKSSLGWLGSILSVIWRSVSVTIQSVVRTSRDSDKPNPHRGFFHTVPAALALGFLTYLGSTIDSGKIPIPMLGTVSFGVLFALTITWLNLHMALAGLAREVMRTIRKSGPLGEAITFAISLTIAFALFTQLDLSASFWWIGVSVAAGMCIHSFGDCFTTAGSPVLFPLPIKGKMWWTVRFLKIRAGGVVEKALFMPFFGVLCGVAFLKIANIL